MTLILRRLASNSKTWSSLYLAEERDTNDTKVNSLWTVSTVFPSLAERKKIVQVGICDYGDQQGLTNLSDLPKVLISMVSPLLPVKATPILRKHKRQSQLRFSIFHMACHTKWHSTLKFRGVHRNQTHNDIRAMKAQLWWHVPQTVVNCTKYCTRIENSNENWHALQTLSQKIKEWNSFKCGNT